MISFIWAEDKNSLIGSNGKLPWHLPDDMAFFKKTTTGNPIISGAKTFRSYNRPLPNRENIVVSRQKDFPKGVKVFSSIKDLIQYVDQYPEKNFFVTGGANIFSQLKDKADRLYRTKIDAEFVGDTYMAKIDYSQFNLVFSKSGVVDDKNQYPHKFQIFSRK